MSEKAQSESTLNGLITKTPKDKNILIVDDNVYLADLISEFLSEKPEYNLFTAYNGSDALQCCNQVYQDVAVMDLHLPDISGERLFEIIKKKHPTTTIFIMSSYDTVETVVEAIKNGACDFIPKPINMELLRLRIEKELKYQESMAMSTTDPLTGLYNRGFLTTVFERELKNVKRIVFNQESKTERRSIKPLSFIFFDIDNFKNYNDTHGHLEGDYVLQKVSRTLMEQCRPTDTVARFGGEEIVILVPETDFETTYTIADRFRQNIEDIVFHPDSDSKTNVTVSGGVSSFDLAEAGFLDISINHIVKAADDALYKAKHNGKNQVWKENLLKKLYQ